MDTIEVELPKQELLPPVGSSADARTHVSHPRHGDDLFGRGWASIAELEHYRAKLETMQRSKGKKVDGVEFKGGGGVGRIL